MSIKIVENKELNEKIMNGFKKANRFVEVAGRPLTDEEVYTFYQISEGLFDLSSTIAEYIYFFSCDDITITNPFYEPTGRFLVSPVSEYGELFLNSNFMALINEIMNEGITKDNYLEKSKELSNRYTKKVLDKFNQYADLYN